MKTNLSPKSSWVKQNYTCSDCTSWTGSPLHCKRGIILASGELCLVRKRRACREDHGAVSLMGGTKNV